MEQNQDGVQAQTDSVGSEETQETTEVNPEKLKQELEALRAHNQRLLSEKKKIQTNFSNLKEETENFRINRLQEEGKTKEALDEALQKIESLQGTLKTKEQRYAESIVFGEIKAKAVELGCVAPDDLIKVIDVNDISINPENYRPDPNEVSSLLERARQEKAHFFAKQAPKVATQRATNEVSQPGSQQVDYMSMSDEDFNRLLAKHAQDKVQL